MCYNTLSTIKDYYKTISGSTKDYIKTPKPNGYKSLHTILKTEDGKMIEVQIRTQQMDEDAEEGVASHNAYKGIIENQKFEKPEWVGDEVSGDPRYFNSNLIKFPYSKW